MCVWIAVEGNHKRFARRKFSFNRMRTLDNFIHMPATTATLLPSRVFLRITFTCMIPQAGVMLRHNS